MKVLIEINCENSTFGVQPGFELERLLNLLAYKCGNYQVEDMPIYDINGNKVGQLTVVN